VLREDLFDIRKVVAVRRFAVSFRFIVRLQRRLVVV
jgi:hypothetical protein